MRIGQRVKVVADEWSLFGKIGRIVDQEIFKGTERCKVEIDGEIVILRPAELRVLG